MHTFHALSHILQCLSLAEVLNRIWSGGTKREPEPLQGDGSQVETRFQRACGRRRVATSCLDNPRSPPSGQKEPFFFFFKRLETSIQSGHVTLQQGTPPPEPEFRRKEGATSQHTRTNIHSPPSGRGAGNLYTSRSCAQAPIPGLPFRRGKASLTASARRLYTVSPNPPTGGCRELG